jgi:hypothetical protein
VFLDYAKKNLMPTTPKAKTKWLQCVLREIARRTGKPARTVKSIRKWTLALNRGNVKVSRPWDREEQSILKEVAKDVIRDGISVRKGSYDAAARLKKLQQSTDRSRSAVEAKLRRTVVAIQTAAEKRAKGKGK